MARFISLFLPLFSASFELFYSCFLNLLNIHPNAGALQHRGLQVRVPLAHVPQAVQLCTGALRGRQRSRALQPRIAAAGALIQVRIMKVRDERVEDLRRAVP